MSANDPKRTTIAPSAIGDTRAQTSGHARVRRQAIGGPRWPHPLLQACPIQIEEIGVTSTPTPERIGQMLAASPAIIYTTKATGDYSCTFVSENISAQFSALHQRR